MSRAKKARYVVDQENIDVNQVLTKVNMNSAFLKLASEDKDLITEMKLADL